MPNASVSFGAFERTGNPTLVARNVYAEQVDTPAGPMLQLRARPGLATFETVGDGPFRATHQKDGLFDNAALILSAGVVYSVTASGVVTAMAGAAIAGDDLVDVDSGQDADLKSVARFATGSALYKLVDGIVTLEDFPSAGGAGATSVAYIGGYWLAVEAGTQKVYVLEPGGTVWGALDFASAEYSPDKLVAVRVRGDQFALMGSSTFEPWYLTGDSSAPVAPQQGLAEKVGCRSNSGAVVCGESLIFVDNLSNVRRWEGGETRVVSNPGLTAKIGQTAAADLVGGYFTITGHRFYVLRLGTNSTWVYDLDAQGERWTTFDTAGYDYWRAQLFCNIGDTVIACDPNSEQTYILDVDRRTDTDEFGVEFSAVIPAADVPQAIANMVVICDLGDAPREGQGSTPIIEAKWSDDTGKLFGDWKERPLPVTGSYNVFPRWNGSGTVPAHHDRIIRFRVSDPVSRVFKAAKVNVP